MHGDLPGNLQQLQLCREGLGGWAVHALKHLGRERCVVDGRACNPSAAAPCVTHSLQDYPEHRLQFFGLLRAITANCFKTLFTLSPAQVGA